MRKTVRNFAAVCLVVAAVVGISKASFGGSRGKHLIIKGSDTMVNLSQAWAEEFMAKHPDAIISVSGGGSGTGIAAFLNGTCDIANSSRAMSAKEMEQSKQRNVLPKGTIAGLDGLAVAVHTNNPMNQISLEDLAAIYSGKFNDWSQLGVIKTPVNMVVLSRESNSGTHVYFKEAILKNKSYGPKVLFMPSTKSIQQEITANDRAIGYGGEAYFKGKPSVKILSVSKKRGGEAIYPSNANVTGGKYPISRPLYMYTAGAPKGLAAEFIKFCLSPEGQNIVERVGYVRLK